MPSTILLKGINYEAEKEQIEKSASNDTLFLLDNSQTELHQYIDCLHEQYGLRTKILSKLRICRQIVLMDKITLYSGDGQQLCTPHSMEELLKRLQPGNRFRLVIENDDRTLLANIVQQLVYIDYPLTEINVTLRKEEKDAKRTDRFMHYIQTLQANAQSAMRQINGLCIDIMSEGVSDETREKLYASRARALTSYQKICEQIKKAQDVEMKVAVAASKKTGKSVLVNCMLGMELAPTSLELATPNNCIYKRSLDGRFHLQTVSDSNVLSQAENFDTAKSLRERISNAFREAQSHVENKFACPDMLISYIGNGNNFESYTVYDTPGPDLAGAAHSVSANKAVNACDVAIFAIDYTKYLTTSEEEFLRQIKDLFQEKQKFHTLIFVINKIDQALNDKGTQSRVKSIDFIRTRLRTLSSHYQDCIVFATSAQDYFWSLELEEAANRQEALACLRERSADLYQKLRPCKDALEDNGCEDEELIRLLSNLDGEVGRIRSQLGYSTVDMEALRLYSGIPQLMAYVSYIARSKARDEIVNSITYDISVQYGDLQILIKEIENIEALRNKTENEISRISKILDDYVAEIKNILGPDLREEDRDCLDSKHLFRMQIDKFQKAHDQSFPISLSAVLSEMQTDIISLEDSSTMYNNIWKDFYQDYTTRLSSLAGQTTIYEKDLKELEVSLNEILQKAVQNYVNRIAIRRLEDEKENLANLTEDLQSMVKNRMDRTAACTQECQRSLKKSDCYLQLPEPPAFEASIAAPKIEGIKIGRTIEMSSLIKGNYKEIHLIRKFLHDLFSSSPAERVYKLSKELAAIDMKPLKSDVVDSLRDAGIYDQIRSPLIQLSNSINEEKNRVLAQFSEMNETCKASIVTFKQGIDDREYYKDRLSDYNCMKELIVAVQSASKDFMDTWSLVANE